MIALGVGVEPRIAAVSSFSQAPHPRWPAPPLSDVRRVRARCARPSSRQSPPRQSTDAGALEPADRRLNRTPAVWPRKLLRESPTMNGKAHAMQVLKLRRAADSCFRSVCQTRSLGRRRCGRDALLRRSHRCTVACNSCCTTCTIRGSGGMSRQSSGLPRVCMSTTPQESPASAVAMSGSQSSPLTSLTISAPAAIAARATSAL